MKVQQEIRRGAAIVFVTKYSGILLGLVVNSVLARLLSPTEFGIVGVVTVFITFFNILSDIGLGSAIIQNQHFTNKDFSDIFKVSVLLSVLLAVAFALLAYPIASFYSDRVYVPISQLLAIQVFFSALSIVPKNMLIKAQAFKTIGLIDVGSAFLTGSLAIALAYQHFSFYSIVWRSIAYSVLVFALYYANSGLKIQSGVSFSGIRGVARYSSYQFAFNCINYFSRNLDNILVGKYIGNAGLGLYNQAYQLMMYPVQNLTHVITPVIHPILAKFQNNKAVIFEEYMKIVRILAILGLPISAFIYFSSPEIIHLFLGEKWLEVVPVLRILSLSIWIQMILSSSGSIYQAAGRTDLLFISGVISGVIMILAILLGVLYFKSLEETAMLLVVSFYINFVVGFYILIKLVLVQSVGALFRLLGRQLPAVIVLIALYLLEANVTRGWVAGPYMLVVSLGIKLILMGLVTAVFNFALIRPFLQKLTPQKKQVMSSGRKPRILTFTHYSAMYGANRSLLTLLLTTRDAIDWWVICREDGDFVKEMARNGIAHRIIPFTNDIHKIPRFPQWFHSIKRFGFNVAVAIYLAAWVAKKRIDLIHTNSSVIFIGAMVALCSGRKHLWHIREFVYEDYQLKYNFGKSSFRYWANQAACIVCISKSIQLKRVTEAGITAPSVVIYNGLVDGQLPEPARHRNETPVAGIIGIIDPAKGQLTALKALHELIKSGFQLNLHIVGEIGDHAYYEDLTAYIKAHELDAFVQFIGYTSDIGTIYNQLDVTLMCSPNEALGRVTIESMMHGVPVVAFDSAGSGELIEHERTGLLFREGAESLAHELRKLLGDHSLYEVIALSARNHVLNNFTITKYRDSFLREVESCRQK